MTVLPPGAAPVLSRLVAVESLPEGGLAVTVDATAAERDSLRALNGLVALETLQASFLVRREGRDGLRVSGEVVADIAQTCVVTLEAFPSTLRESVDVHFLEAAALERWRRDHAADPADPDAEQPDEPDAIVGGRIDLGALAAEHLALGLDPYPKKPGASFDEVAPAVSEGASPFAALKALRPDGG